MKPLHAGLAAVALGLAFGVAAGCTGGAGKVVSATQIDVQFRTPINESGATAFCQGSRSLVLALDSAGGQSESWDRIFVLGVDDQTLYGCGRDPDGRLERCASDEIQAKIESPDRVLAEWLDVPPQEYEREPGNVVCRGMYDVATGMGERSTHDDGGVRTLSLTILLLRVGDTNHLHDLGGATSPRGVWMAASPIVHPNDLATVFGAQRDPEGGLVAVAGGQLASGEVSSEIHVFEPHDIAFQREGDLPAPAAGLTANSISLAAAKSYVVFAGGWDASLTAQDTAAAFDYTENASEVMPFTLIRPRAHHSAIRLEEIGNPSRNAIGLYGGCDQNLTVPTIGGVPGAGAEVFHLVETSPEASCVSAGPGYLCSSSPPGVDQIPRCFMAAGPFRSTVDPAVTLRGWLAGGFTGGSTLASGSDRYEVQTDGTHTQPAAGTAAYLPLAGAATVPLPGDQLAVIGGLTEGLTSSRALLYVSATDPAVVSTGGVLQTGRVFLTATLLFDGSILVTGGVEEDGAPENLVEIGRMSSSGAMVFSYPMKIGGAACDTGAEPGCVALQDARFGHTATRIEGTSTWLNGAVLITGGSGDAEPEIYVPAYECDESKGLDPVVILGGSEQLVEHVDFCDRGRRALGSTTNPDAP